MNSPKKHHKKIREKKPLSMFGLGRVFDWQIVLIFFVVFFALVIWGNQWFFNKISQGDLFEPNLDDDLMLDIEENKLERVAEEIKIKEEQRKILESGSPTTSDPAY